MPCRSPSFVFLKKKNIFLLLLSIQLASFAQNPYTIQHKEVQYFIYDLKIVEAKKAIEYLSRENIWTQYLIAKVEVFGQFCTPNLNSFESSLKEIDKQIDLIRSKNVLPKYKYFFEGEIQFHKAWLAFQFSDYIKSARALHLAKQNLRRSLDLDKNFLLPLKSLGVINTLFGAIPKKYLWATNAIGYEGDVDQGIDALSKLSKIKTNENKANYWLIKEATYWLALLELHIQNNPEKSWNTIKSNGSNDEINLMDIYLKTIVAQKIKKNEEVFQSVSYLEERKNEFPILYYYLGLTYLYRLDARCEERFLQFLKSKNKQKFAASTLQKLSWWYFLNGDEFRYETTKQKLISLTNLRTERDLQAQKEAHYSLNKKLLHTRILWDGGYTQEAQSILQTVKISSLTDKTFQAEYYYRMGQLSRQLKNKDDAIKYYKKAIEIGTSLPRCFAAKSSLKLGEIYHRSGQIQDALEYYEMATTFHKNKEYKRAIELKAKGAKKRIIDSN